MISRRTFASRAALFVLGCAMAVQLNRRPGALVHPVSSPISAISKHAAIIRQLIEDTKEIQHDFLHGRIHGTAAPEWRERLAAQ